MNVSLSSLAAVGLLLATPLLALAQAGSAADEPERHRKIERTISVTGNGKVSAAPDIAEISIAVVSQADTARAALAANTEAMTAVQKLLKERGVAEKDIQTTQISVTPRYTQPAPPRPGQAQATEFVPRIAGYDVTNAVQITARDIGKLGTILDAVVQSGANRIDNIAFRLGEPEKLLDQARKHAMADAKRKAEQLAGDSGVVVGPPITISESGVIPPVPMYGGVRGRMMEMAAAAPVPVAAGEQELSVDVSVIYELRLPE